MERVCLPLGYPCCACPSNTGAQHGTSHPTPFPTSPRGCLLWLIVLCSYTLPPPTCHHPCIWGSFRISYMLYAPKSTCWGQASSPCYPCLLDELQFEVLNSQGSGVLVLGCPHIPSRRISPLLMLTHKMSYHPPHWDHGNVVALFYFIWLTKDSYSSNYFIFLKKSIFYK